MIEIAKFGTLFLLAKLVGCACVLVPAAYEAPIRAIQPSMYYKVSTQGPGGFDDAVQISIVDAPAQYASGVGRLLRANDGTGGQEAGLYFAEYVANDAAVRAGLMSLAERNPDQATKEFVRRLLDGTDQAEQGIQPDGPASGWSARYFWR